MESEAMRQPIICFEGPSGVGKTTLCNVLSEKCTIVPEVNLLFERGNDESKYWYHDRQVDRYQMCRKSQKKSILDGDVFQPVWYNWVCNYPSNFLSKEETHSYYKEKLIQGEIAFPDLYIIFHIDELELRKRKENDTTRRRRNFEKHLKIIEPLKTYYRFLDEETEVEMKFVKYDSLATAKAQVEEYIDNANTKEIDQLRAFEEVEEWINENEAKKTI